MLVAEKKSDKNKGEKENEKSIICSFVIMLISALCITANALSVGDVVNHTLYTDIVARINGYDIQSYNIDGYTAVVAEDLSNYGLQVTWDARGRVLYINRGYKTNVDSKYTAPKVLASLNGKKASNVLHTDIKTYINGEVVKSYNIGGKTIIYFEDLNVYGTVKWNFQDRIISLNVPNLKRNPNVEREFVSLTNLTPVTEEHVIIWKDSSSTTNIGTKLLNPISPNTRPYNKSDINDFISNGGYVEYHLGGEYVELSGTFAFSQDRSNDGYMKIKISVDGYTIYTSKALYEQDNPINFNLDVSGCERLRIKFIPSTDVGDWDYDEGAFQIGNLKLYSDY